VILGAAGLVAPEADLAGIGADAADTAADTAAGVGAGADALTTGATGAAQAESGYAYRGAAQDASRLGQTVSPLGRTYENYDSYLEDVADHYGINLRGAQGNVSPIFDYGLSIGQKGLTKQAEGGFIIRINPGFEDEADLANTIAHELSHARDFQNGLLQSPEGPAEASGNALEEYINGQR
jgi:hypothetical protein